METTFKKGYTTAKHLSDQGFTLEDLFELIEEEESISCGKWDDWLEGFRYFIIEVL